MSGPGREASPKAKVWFSVNWKVIRGSGAWMRAVKLHWTHILEPADRSRFPRPIHKIRRSSIPIYTLAFVSISSKGPAAASWRAILLPHPEGGPSVVKRLWAIVDSMARPLCSGVWVTGAMWRV